MEKWLTFGMGWEPVRESVSFMQIDWKTDECHRT